jgi:hypothetical protein
VFFYAFFFDDPSNWLASEVVSSDEWDVMTGDKMMMRNSRLVLFYFIYYSYFCYRSSQKDLVADVMHDDGWMEFEIQTWMY